MKGTSVVAAVLAGVLGAVAGSCSRGRDQATDVKVGVSLPLTGDAAVWGKSQKDGYDLAAKQINDRGGVKGKKLVLLYGDDRGLPREGVAVLQKFLDVDHIRLLTGVANSSVALAYIPIVTQRRVLFVSSGASSPKLSGSSKYFFRTWPSDNAEGVAMAKYAFHELRLARVAVLYINNDYGIGLLEPFSRTLKELGGIVLGAESFEQSATDFRTQLTKLGSLQPQALYLAGNPREMARAIKQARELGITTQILSISTLNDREVFGITGPGAIRGTVITDASFDPDSGTPAARKFMLDFRATFKQEPGILANTAYDALMIVAHAVERAGEDPEGLTSYLHGMKDYDGVGGKISFSAGGDVNRPIRIARAEGGKFVSLVNDFRWY
jgi:branched-chain amino acid transport system substrate-binding protein